MRHTTLLAVVALGLLCHQASALVDLGRLVPFTFEWQPPVTRWLLPSDPALMPPSDVLAWRKIGSKLYTFMNKLDHDFVNAAGQTTPPALAVQRVFGPSVDCGRFTRQFIRMPFHDCGTFDIGNTGSVGDTGGPRFGCNGSLRKEVAPCDAAGPQCVNGVEAAVDLATGAFLPRTAFADVEAKYGAAAIDWGQDPIKNRRENTGFANMLAFLYQVKMETLVDEPPATSLAQVSLADIMMYAGMLAVAKCGGPHIEFHPGRTDSAVFDAPERLPAPTEPLHHTISYFWTNGLTDFDAVNLLAAHTTACFSVGCLDATPTRYDTNWARQISTVTTATDPRICNFAPADAELPPPAPVQLCFLPADAELNARADFRQYLSALLGTTPISTAAAQHNPCFYQPGVPVIPGEVCDVGVGVGYDFTPFSLQSAPGLQGGPVNLCDRNSIPLQERSACPRGAAQAAFRRAVATSYFKMTMLYADATGAVAGTPYGVQRQPCTPGLIQIGTVNVVAPPNPACPCCPNPLPQDFNLGLELEAPDDGLEAPDELVPLRFPTNHD